MALVETLPDDEWLRRWKEKQGRASLSRAQERAAARVERVAEAAACAAVPGASDKPRDWLVLSDELPVERGRVPAKAIVQIVAKRHGLRVEQLSAPTRVRPIAWARQEAMYLIYALTGLSMPQIAARVGLKDHSTVHFGVRAVQARHGLPSPDEISGAQAIRFLYEGRP